MTSTAAPPDEPGRHEDDDAPDEQRDPLALDWPRPRDEMFYGLAGDLVRRIEPHTEADAVGLLVTFLLSFGSAVGSAPHAMADGHRHGLNEFALLVGDTAKGRKGTAASRIREVMLNLDPTWTNTRVTSGLSTGEGLITAVRDAEETKDEGGKTVDEGVVDKRLLVEESEFGGSLKVMGRESNILSAILRQAWDSGNLRVMTRSNPLRATGAHISVIGHITRDEITRHLKEVELFNGFANRFLWACVRRSKPLPDGTTAVDYGDTLLRLRKALTHARSCAVRPIVRDDLARTYWHKIYSTLSDGRPGILGGLLSRAEAHVLRISLLYALLDGSSTVSIAHLRAAVALWEYCEDSVKWTFRTATGHRLADDILEGIAAITGNAGVTRTGIQEQLGRNRSKYELDEALEILVSQGLIEEFTVPGVGKRQGRPPKSYRLTTQKDD